MEIEFAKKFVRQVGKIKQENIKTKLAELLEKVKEIESFQDIENLKKLKGYDTAYRIRLGDYRLGLFYEDDKITFAAFLHRKDVYKYFP